MAVSAAVVAKGAALVPVAFKAHGDAENAPQELKESVAKVRQMHGELAKYHAQGYSRNQLQPLSLSTERLEKLYHEAYGASADYEQSRKDMANGAFPTRAGAPVAKWAIGGYTDEMEELQQAVNKEHATLKRMQPPAKPAGEPAEEKQIANTDEGKAKGKAGKADEGKAKGKAGGKGREEAKGKTKALADDSRDEDSGEREGKRKGKGTGTGKGKYTVGDKIEVWSMSQNSWCPGQVVKLGVLVGQRIQGEIVTTVAYDGVDGARCEKLVPIGCEYLRRPDPDADKAEPISTVQTGSCSLCSTGCGRPAAYTFETCCRTCPASGGANHGPTCQSFHESMSFCLSGATAVSATPGLK